jgi:hypothetical protein
VYCISYQETFFQTSFFEFYNVGCSLRCVQFRCKAVWVKIHGADSTPVTASLMADNNSTYDCVGTVLPEWMLVISQWRIHSWYPSSLSILYFLINSKPCYMNS